MRSWNSARNWSALLVDRIVGIRERDVPQIALAHAEDLTVACPPAKRDRSNA